VLTAAAQAREQPRAPLVQVQVQEVAEHRVAEHQVAEHRMAEHQVAERARVQAAARARPIALR
jgi:hypothetical protein